MKNIIISLMSLVTLILLPSCEEMMGDFRSGQYYYN